MKFGFLIIASEILNGKISDLNGKKLVEFLQTKGLSLSLTLVVPDDEKMILEALDFLYSKVNVVITSGGLGPTLDDLTKETLGKYFQKTTEFSDEALVVATQNYERHGRVFPGKDHGYSFLPKGFKALSNSTGFAPGLFFSENHRTLFSAPGVPREFSSMLKDHFFKLIPASETYTKNFIARTKRVPEEKIFKDVDPTLWEKLSHFGDVSSLPIVYGVDIGVTLKAQSQAELDEKEKNIFELFKSSPIFTSVWHFGSESIEEVIIKKAAAKKITIALAESCTGGYITHRLTNVSGSSSVIKGSFVTYQETMKTEILEIPADFINQKGVVSPEVAKEMASQTRQKLNVDLAFSTTGYAGPTGGDERYPVGSVCLGVSRKNLTESSHYHFHGDREALKQRFTQALLYLILEEVEKFAEV